MAHTAHKSGRAMEEVFMSEDEIRSKCQEVAELVKKYSEIIFFTGAGLSTSSGIKDYRSSDGLWTMKAQGRESEFKSLPLHLARPTFGHMAIVEFQNRNKLSAVISQNVDGLHLKSGIHKDNICELHGNSTIEECADCGKPHHRDLCISGDNQHVTGRRCVACNGLLRDTIINFGETLNPLVLKKAYDTSNADKLHICLGSSLAVSPANDLPRATKRNGGKMVIVNVQRTPLDVNCDVRLHCKIDDFFACLFEILGWTVPPFTLRRQVSVVLSPSNSNNNNNNNNNITKLQARLCGTLPRTDVPSSSFATVDFYDTATDSLPGLAHLDFTKDAKQMNDICPSFEIDMATVNAPAFVVTSFFQKERNEPGPVELPFDDLYHQYKQTVGNNTTNNNNTNNIRIFEISATYDNQAQKYSDWKITHTDTNDQQVKAVLASRASDSASFDSASASSSSSLFPLVPPSFERGRGATRVEGIKTTTKNGKDKDQQQDFSGWFAVTPMSDCPHTKEIKFADGCVFDINRECEVESCKNIGENMMCFTCGKVFCGRHVKSHMLELHYKETEHPIVCGFADLSVWCYKCDAYLKEDNPRVAPLHRILYAQKFGSNEEQVLVDSSSASSGSKSRRQKPTQAAINKDDDDDNDTTEQEDNTSNTNNASPQRRDRQSDFSKYKEELDGTTAKRSGFAVQPLPSCPHTTDEFIRLQEGATFDAEAKCENCGAAGENWQCLFCNKIFCSRYQNACMQGHYHEGTEKQHPLAVSYADLSVWCSACEEYISPKNDKVSAMVKLATMAKFGDDDV